MLFDRFDPVDARRAREAQRLLGEGPRVANVEVIRHGKVRRAKLYFLRDRGGKATRLKEVKRPVKKAPKLEPAAEADES